MTEFDLTREIHGAFKVTGDKGVGGGHQRATCVFLFLKAGICYQGWAGVKAPHILLLCSLSSL